MTELSVIVLAFHNSIDVLKRTLPSSKAALPNAKIFVATSSDDREVLALCTALGVKTIQFTKDVTKKDGAEFNYAGVARSCITFARNDVKKEHWILITRPQVMLDSRLSEIPIDSLAKDSLYGCGMKELLTTDDLAKYKPSEPSSLEVRDLVPTSSFLLSYSAPPQFDAWSRDTKSAVQRFSACFIAKYMIHLNLAYLGVKKRDDDAKVSEGVWGYTKADKLRIEPVHAFAAKQEEEESETKTMSKTQPQQAAAKVVKKSKLFGVLSGDEDSESYRSRVRTELDAQQNVASAPPTTAEDMEIPKSSEKSKKNIWAAKLIED
jgi:Flp pilus assembly protein TadG